METTQNEHKELSSIALFKLIDNLGLEEAQKEKIINLFLRNPRTRVVNTRDISREADVPLAISHRIIVLLVENHLLAYNSTLCPHCGQVVDYFPKNGRCLYCTNDLNLSESLSVTLNGSLDELTDKMLSKQSATVRATQRLSKAWEKKGCIYYMILDLVSSQSVQNTLKDDGYALFLQKIRAIVKYKVFPHTEGAVLSFGEVGDMHKVAFENFDDAINAVCLLSKHLPERPESLSEDIDFPCYSGSITRLPIPINKNGDYCDPKSLLAVTINGAPDINSIALTNFYRFDSKINTGYSIYKDKCDISLWYIDPKENDKIPILPTSSIAELNFAIKKSCWKQFSFEKNDVSGESNGCLIYFKNGEIKGIEDNPNNTVGTG